MKRLKLKHTELQITIKRLTELADADSVIFPTLVRSEAREAKFHWIGKVLEEKYCFAQLVGRPKITSIEDAKKVKGIAVNSGGNSEAVMKKSGLTNLSLSLGNTANARKLAAGVVDAWFTSENLAKQGMKDIGENPDQVQCNGDGLGQVQYWLGASKKTPDAQVAEFRKTFDALVKEGFLKSLMRSSP